MDLRSIIRNARKRANRAVETLEQSENRRVKRNQTDRNRQLQDLPSMDVSNVVEFNCGNMNETCNFCQAKYWKAEENTSKQYTVCCHNGKVCLPAFSEAPDLLMELFCSNSTEAKNFRQHIRKYNAALAFASMGAEIKLPCGSGRYCFRIHGQIYHMVPPLYPNEVNNPGYGQLYIFDSSDANNFRMRNNEGCLRTLMDKLDLFLRTINPFAESYMQMHRLIQDSNTMNVKMVFMEQPDLDMRRYNTPTTNTEVAAIFVGEDGEPPAHRDICIYPKDNHCQKISPMNQWCDPMVYPLIFPRGESGWFNGIKHVQERQSAKRINVTQLQYYAYRFSVRHGFSLLHHSGKLFQQYIVDAYVKTEGNRLSYIRLNQKNLRVELYSGLLDALRFRAESESLRMGKLIILPSTFQGSPRFMQQNYQDAMAIVRRFGRPDLFITFTCNPTWPEILDAMENNQSPENRPDIVVRVFKLKLNEMLNDILKRNLFGNVLAYIYVIEFQKRGLPHAHILLTLDGNSKIRTKDDIDKYVSAELPDIIRNPRLFEIVMKCMIHGPCGAVNPRSPCMKEGVCSKQFPKDERDSTAENVNGYPIYRRRVITPVRHAQYDIDNRWVVPYNPWLLKKFNAHINVEVCASIKSVKYLYKYVYKGHDAASVKLQANDTVHHDEILNFLDGRYVSAPEAMWRLNEFSMSDKSHAITRLAVHLPDQQQIFYQEGQEESALQQASRKNTTLTAWFDLNNSDEEARRYNYTDIPNHYVFHKDVTKWKKRLRGGDKIIGRIPVVNVQDSERYYLRMLLLHKPGGRSFEDLKTVNGIVCNSFQSTCKELGYLQGDDHWHETLVEASQTQVPSSLRMLFAIICGFCEVENVLELWMRHKDSLSEDFAHRYCAETAPHYALSEISELLKAYGLKLEALNLPAINSAENFQTSEFFDVLDEQSKAKINMGKLNQEQYLVVNSVLNSVYENINNKHTNLYFLDGPAGTGKTFVYLTLLHTLRGKGDHVTPVASTGIAATLLPGGRTAHSVFKIPLILNGTSTCNLKPNSVDAKLLVQTKLILWDEAPMTHVHAFLAVDRLLRDLTQSSVPFGGKVVLLGGDFRQVLPVILKGSRSLTVSSCLKKHRIWSAFKIMSLTKNMRALDSEKEFANWLLNVGEASTGDKLKLPSVCYPQVQDPVKQLYNDIDFNSVTPQQLTSRAILTVTNDLSMEINQRVLDCLPSAEMIYESVDTIVTENPQDQLAYPEEFLNSLTPTGMPPHKLKIKCGAIIMLLRNLVPSKGLCNGARLIVTNLQRNFIEAKRIDDNLSETIFIPRIYLIPSDSNMPFKFKRRQFPIRLAFSMTINKSQGQTFEKIVLDLTKPVFSHGQLYVGLSRVRSFDSVTIVSPTSEIRNCVYKEVLDE